MGAAIGLFFYNVLTAGLLAGAVYCVCAWLKYRDDDWLFDAFRCGFPGLILLGVSLGWVR